MSSFQWLHLIRDVTEVKIFSRISSSVKCLCHIGVRTKVENFRNAPKPNFDLYVISFICSNFEAFTTFSAIFTRIRCTKFSEIIAAKLYFQKF